MIGEAAAEREKIIFVYNNVDYIHAIQI